MAGRREGKAPSGSGPTWTFSRRSQTLTEVDELVVFGGGAKSALLASAIGYACCRPVRSAKVVGVAKRGAFLRTSAHACSPSTWELGHQMLYHPRLSPMRHSLVGTKTRITNTYSGAGVWWGLGWWTRCASAVGLILYPDPQTA